MPNLVLTTGTTAVGFTGGGRMAKFVGTERRAMKAIESLIETLEAYDIKRPNRRPRSRLSEIPIFPSNLPDLLIAKNTIKQRLADLLAM